MKIKLILTFRVNICRNGQKERRGGCCESVQSVRNSEDARHSESESIDQGEDFMYLFKKK